MEEKAEDVRRQRRQINREIRRISLLNGIRFTRNSVFLLLFIGFMLQVYYKYPPMTLTIGVTYGVLIVIMKAVIQTKKMVQEPRLLPLLSERYQYNSVEYQGNLIAFYILFILLIAWQRANNASGLTRVIILKFPSILLVVSSVILLIVFFYYRMSIPYRLKNNV